MNAPTDFHNDDDLGAALGASIRGRVDDLPTITPGFDGVERRARQMTNRRRALAGAAIGAFALVAGIGVASIIDDDTALEQEVFDDPDQPETDTPAPIDDLPTAENDRCCPTDEGDDDLATDPETDELEDVPAADDGDDIPDIAAGAEPEFGEWVSWDVFGIGDVGGAPVYPPTGAAADLLATAGNTVMTIQPDGAGVPHFVITGDRVLEAALRAPDGTWLVQVRQPAEDGAAPTTVVLQVADTEARVLPGGRLLTGTGAIDGRDVVVLGDIPVFTGEAGSDAGDLVLVDLDTLETTVVYANAYGLEWFVTETFIGGDTIFVDGSGFRPFWDYRTADGDALTLASPTDGRYGDDWGDTLDGDGPNADRAALAEDGSTLYWVELEAPDPLTLEVFAELHAMNTDTGEEAPTVTIPLGVSQVMLHTDLTIAGEELLLTTFFDGGLDGEGGTVQEWLAPIVIDIEAGTWIEIEGLPAAEWRFAD